jgi:Glyoxalase-like domain
MPVARLTSISLDCSDPQPLAEFWAALLEAEIVHRSDRFWAVRTSEGWLTAVAIDDYAPPSWPGPDVPKQMHLDLSAPDLDVAEERALSLGARKADHQLAPDRFRVFYDPAGHPFCLTAGVPD